MAQTNPYARSGGGPIPGKAAEWQAWEDEREQKRRDQLTPEARQREDANRRGFQRRVDAELPL